MSQRLLGKIAIVTGSSSGIGRAIAEAYRHEGCTVVHADLVPPTRTDIGSSGTAPVPEISTQDGAEYDFIRTDMTRSEDVKAAVEFAVAKYGRLDIMVNNAGIAPEIQDLRPVWETDESMWNKTNDVNSRGVFFGTKYAALQMISQHADADGSKGSIINLSSVCGLRAIVGSVAYCASKHSVIGITKCAALECGPRDVRVNAICPGYVDTPILKNAAFWSDPSQLAAANARHALGGVGRPEKIAGAAVFLACKDSCWVNGATMPVDGGYICA